MSNATTNRSPYSFDEDPYIGQYDLLYEEAESLGDLRELVVTADVDGQGPRMLTHDGQWRVKKAPRLDQIENEEEEED